jgi:hypothetical protein
MDRPDTSRLNLIEQTELAAQIVSIMDARFARPNCDEKRWILELARQQIADREQMQPHAITAAEGREQSSRPHPNSS